MNELVSVVIPTYGRTEELKRAIKSAITQTYKNIEIIIVDDNVEDEINEKIEEIVDSFKDKRIVILKNEKNLGGALSRNEGIKAAKGNYIAFLDDDDEYLSFKIEKQLGVFNFANEDLALVYGYCRGIDSNGKEVDYCYDYKGNCLYDAMRTCIAATSQWMCRKNALVNVGMFSDVPCKQDSIVMIKLLAADYTIDRVPEILSIYHDDNIQRISSRGGLNAAKKRIIGETKLRDLCRLNYGKITKKEQREVEYSFAFVLVGYYQIIGDKKSFRENLKKIITTHFFSKQSLNAYKGIIKIEIKKIIKKL